MEAETEELVTMPIERNHAIIYQEYLDMRDKKNRSFSNIQAANIQKQKLAKISAYCTSISFIVKNSPRLSGQLSKQYQ